MAIKYYHHDKQKVAMIGKGNTLTSNIKNVIKFESESNARGCLQYFKDANIDIIDYYAIRITETEENPQLKRIGKDIKNIISSASMYALVYGPYKSSSVEGLYNYYIINDSNIISVEFDVINNAGNITGIVHNLRVDGYGTGKASYGNIGEMLHNLSLAVNKEIIL